MKKSASDARMITVGLLCALSLVLAVTDALPATYRPEMLGIALILAAAYGVMYLRDPQRKKKKPGKSFPGKKQP